MKTITVRMHTYRVSPDDLTTQPAGGPDHADRLTVLYGSSGLRGSRRRLPPVGICSGDRQLTVCNCSTRGSRPAATGST
jgi:hypothetical protein